MAAVLQGKISNFETDLFTPLIARAGELTHTRYQDGRAPTDASLRIIADHSRAATFLISDGVLPANEGRGYVLRKILRRGIRHGRMLGQEDAFMYRMVEAVRDEMQAAYPELAESAGRVARVIRAEEERFGRTLALGSKQLDAAIEQVRKDAGETAARHVAGRNCLPSLRDLRPAAGLHGGCGPRPGHRLRSDRL
jgi:alanyl-tRNA synthetase